MKGLSACMCFVAIPGCLYVASNQGSMSAMTAWAVVFCVGFVLFVISRFRDKC